MTISVVQTCLLLSVIAIGAAIALVWLNDMKSTSKMLVIIAGIVAVIVIWGVGYWYCNFTASGQRALKTQRSELGAGMRREITIYNMQGEVIEHYEGTFDVDTSSEGSAARILFDDEEGNRHIIYPGSGIVIINEMG